MSKERARRRAQREAEARAQAEAAQRRRERIRRRRGLVQAAAKPVDSATAMGKVLWSPLSTGQTGLLARRRLRRFLAVAVTLIAANLVVYVVTLDTTIAMSVAGVSLLIAPLLATVLFGGKR